MLITKTRILRVKTRVFRYNFTRNARNRIWKMLKLSKRKRWEFMSFYLHAIHINAMNDNGKFLCNLIEKFSLIIIQRSSMWLNIDLSSSREEYCHLYTILKFNEYSKFRNSWNTSKKFFKPYPAYNDKHRGNQMLVPYHRHFFLQPNMLLQLSEGIFVIFNTTLSKIRMNLFFYNSMNL